MLPIAKYLGLKRSEKNLEQFFRVALKGICGLLIWMSKDMCFSEDEMR